MDKPDLVLLVHGFMANRWSMLPLALRLRRHGFRTKLWGYPSLFRSIATHADALRSFLHREHTGAGRIHFVAHSMGSIVVRMALVPHLEFVGNVVLIAPPNRGSPMARLGSPFFPPLKELRSGSHGTVDRMGTSADYRIGIIAGSLDLLVPVENTRLASCRSHRTLFATHNSLLISSRAAALVSQFLTHGDFRGE